MNAKIAKSTDKRESTVDIQWPSLSHALVGPGCKGLLKLKYY